MGRAPCCDKANVKKGPWSPEEDAKLKAYIEEHGTGGNWIALPQKIGLKRCGKSCRLRWLNYLRPNIKHGGFSEEEDNIICSLYISIGSRWSIIAAQLPGRTDNDIKNYWNTRLKKKLMGRQRKEQQARRASMKQEIKRETETAFMAPGSVMMSSFQQHTHYWPELPAVMPTVVTNTIPNQLDNNLNFMDQESIRNLLMKLGGRFSEDHQVHQDQSSFINTNYQVVADSYSTQDQLYASSTSMLSSPATMNSIDSTGSTNYSVNGGDQMMVQGIENFPIELDDYVYGNSGQELEGLESLYGMDHISNVGNTGTGTSSTSAESSNWPGSMSSLIYEHQLASEYGTNCLQSMPQDSPFEDSSHHHYFGPQ